MEVLDVANEPSYMDVSFQDNQFGVWLTPNPASTVCVLFVFLSCVTVCTHKSSTFGPIFPVSVVDSFYCVIYSATSDPDWLRISGKKEVCPVFSFSLQKPPANPSKILSVEISSEQEVCGR